MSADKGVRQRILEALEALGSATVDEVAERIGLDRRRVSMEMSRIKAAGGIVFAGAHEMTGRFLYRLPEGQSAAEVLKAARRRRGRRSRAAAACPDEAAEAAPIEAGAEAPEIEFALWGDGDVVIYVGGASVAVLADEAVRRLSRLIAAREELMALSAPRGVA